VNAVLPSDTHARALQSLGAMTATVAHEMRNLLGGVELYATLVAEQCAKDADLQPMTGRLLEGVTRLRAVAANLLSVSRRPEPAIEHTTVDLVMLLGTLAENTALALPGTGVELTTDVKLAKAPVAGDGEQIRQALLNLVLNAVQAMPKGGALTLSLRPRPGGRVAIAVKDTGTGMSRATLRQAFEPFFTTRPRGTGIGLAVVREVAERHGAKLTVTSRPGCGTTFTLTFELVETGEHHA
jgi:two-component system, NtrC family, sensor histidine kinase HydH